MWYFSFFQGQACAIVLRGLQSRDIQQLLAGPRWTELCQKTVEKVTEVRFIGGGGKNSKHTFDSSCLSMVIMISAFEALNWPSVLSPFFVESWTRTRNEK